MENSTATALVALLIALLALIVALAQVFQQYFITGQLIRICDSVVYGPMPGQGRRIWEAAQFRFRVVYSIPQIGLPANLFPKSAPHVPSYSNASRRLPYLPLLKRKFSSARNRWFRLDIRPTRYIGEASWVTFCRVICYSCEESVRYELVEKDADRHPSDVPVVAMQVSLRDIVVMAFMAGMECTAADFKEQSVSMQGACGSITTSQHPILGALIHFTSRNITDDHGFRTNYGSIDGLWLCRTWDNLSVAEKVYNRRDRGFVEDLEIDWGKDKGTAPVRYSHTVPKASEYSAEENRRKSIYTFTGKDLPQPILRTNLPLPGSSQGRIIEARQSDPLDDIPRGLHDGRWRFGTHLRRLGPSSGPALITFPMPGNSGLDSERSNHERRKPALHRRAIMAILQRARYFLGNSALQSTEYWSETDLQDSSNTSRVNSSIHGQERERNLRFQATVEDDHRSPSQISLPISVSSVVSSEIHPSPLEHSPVADFSGRGRQSTRQRESVVALPTEREDATASERQRLAQELQQKRREKAAKEREDEHVVKKLEEEGRVPEFRSGQRQIEWRPNDAPGPSQATPDEDEAFFRQEARDRERDLRNRARRERLEKRRERLDNRGYLKWFWVAQMDIVPGVWATPWRPEFKESVCIGATQVILQALLGLTDEQLIRYVPPQATLQYTDWARDGNLTFPAYAINARNGVVVAGQYERVRLPAFASMIPPLELHYSYGHQVSDEWIKDVASSWARTAELMAIDSWLSICGRTPEISQGGRKLLRKTPALVQFVLDEYQDDFEEPQLSAKEGGLQVIQAVTENVLDTFDDQRLSEAEQIYVLVAMLRAVKVARSIIQGVDTAIVGDILRYDAQVYFA